MKVSATRDDWRDIICCGLENQQIDFKSHQNWDTIGRVGRAKFARHAMALANTQGGYVVIGVSEAMFDMPKDMPQGMPQGMPEGKQKKEGSSNPFMPGPPERKKR